MCYLLLKLPITVVYVYVIGLTWAWGVVAATTPVQRALGLNQGGPLGRGAGNGLPLCVLGVALLFLAPWAVHLATLPERLLLRWLPGRRGLAERVRDLEETRARAVDDAAATLRRIERDLHDGTQVRLVALTMQLAMVRDAVADDAAVLRDGLAHLLTARGHEVVAGVGDAGALRAAVAAHRPDVAVIDIRMPPTHTDEGLRAAIELRRDHPDLGILLFSQYIETRFARDLLGGSPAGVGYLLKERVGDTDDFVDALRRVAAGGTALDPEVVAHLLTPARRGVSALTPREREVLGLMAEGRTNAAIATTLVVSERAVEKHIANIFLKLDLPPSGDDHRRVLAVLRYLGV